MIGSLDRIAGIEDEPFVSRWLDRLIFVFMTLSAATIPHSIAASQSSCGIGLLLWIIRSFLTPRRRFVSTKLLLPLVCFFLWSAVSSVFSYAPDISIPKLPGVLLLIIFVFFVNQLRTLRSARFIALSMVVSVVFSVAWMPVSRLIGKGISVSAMAAESPLKRVGIQEGDVLLKVNGKRISSPETIVDAIRETGKGEIEIYRDGWTAPVGIPRETLIPGDGAAALGLSDWSVGRRWRYAGFLGHYATYSEILQLVGALVIGIAVAGIWSRRKSGRTDDKVDDRKLNLSFYPLLFGSFAIGIGVAMVETLTRASQGALLFAGLVAFVLGATKRAVVLLLVVSVPLTVAAMIYIQQTRKIGFIDLQDTSTTYRLTVYREGLGLATRSPRDFVLGVGMDSIKRFKDEWRLFDNGRLNMGHFHSTPLQLVIERGFPALLIWLWVFGTYISILFHALRKGRFRHWIDKGIVLGSLAGAAGFFASGLVHYNLGDSEVAMVFYMLMALSVFIAREVQRGPDDEQYPAPAEA